MIIGIDIDDTITNTKEISQKMVNEYKPNWIDYHTLPKEEYDEFLTKYIDKIVINNTLKDKVKEAFDWFKENNYKIVIITARNNIYSSNVIELTKEFLKNNNLEYDKIVFDEEDIDKKGIMALENKVDIFIDDKEVVLKEVKPYVKKCLRFSKDSNSQFECFDSWEKIIEYFKREGKEKWMRE